MRAASFFFLLMTSFFSFFLVAKVPSVARYDMEKILTNLPEAKENKEKMENLIASKEKELIKKQEKIQKMYTEFEGQQKFLSDEKKKEKFLEIEKERQALEAESMKMKQEVAQTGQSLNKPLLDRITSVAIEVSKENEEIMMTIPRGEPLLDYGFTYIASEVDITDKVLKRYNKNYPKKK